MAKVKQAAQTLVERVLDLPAPLAAASAAELQRAVEYLELAPKLADIDKAMVVKLTLALGAHDRSLAIRSQRFVLACQADASELGSKVNVRRQR